MLEAMREHGVPTIVVHGENDLVVPFESAQDMADRADGTLYRVPGAYHSWMLANPRHGADMVRQLLAAELGDVLRDAARAHGVMGPVAGRRPADRGFASAFAGGGPLEAVGIEPLEHVEMDRLRSANAYRRAVGAARVIGAGSTWRRRPAFGVNGRNRRHRFASGLASRTI